MSKYYLQCLACNEKYTQEYQKFVCEKCNGQLQIHLDYNTLKTKITSKEDFLNLSPRFPNSLWKYFDFLPLLDEKDIISLGEGMTPLVKCNNLGKILGCENVYVKNETGNPTGSFKDRQVSMGVSKARELKKKGILTVSSGNVGAAVSAYGAKANFPTMVLVHGMSPTNKVLQIQTYGANLLVMDSNSTGDILEAVDEYCKKYNFQNLITGSTVNPYINHGAKTMALEIISECLSNDNVPMPDTVIIPVGGGGLLALFYHGLLDLVELGIIEKAPRVIGVQPAGCPPLAKAVLEDGNIEELFTNPWKDLNTIATALADDVPLDARIAIPAIKQSGGTAVIVDDQQILEGEKLLATSEGIFAEPSSSTTVAALKLLIERKEISPTETVVLLITGSGFKDMDACSKINPKTRKVPLDHDWESEFLSTINSNKNNK
jgi:threonine synthase